MSTADEVRKMLEAKRKDPVEKSPDFLKQQRAEAEDIMKNMDPNDKRLLCYYNLSLPVLTCTKRTFFNGQYNEIEKIIEKTPIEIIEIKMKEAKEEAKKNFSTAEDNECDKFGALKVKSFVLTRVCGHEVDEEEFIKLKEIAEMGGYGNIFDKVNSLPKVRENFYLHTMYEDERGCKKPKNRWVIYGKCKSNHDM